MSNRRIAALAAASALAGFMPLMAFAQQSVQHVDAPSHFAANEAGIKAHAELAGAGKSTDQVDQELAAARNDPKWKSFLAYGTPVPATNARPKTRAEVTAELERAQRHPGWDRASRSGAPLVLPPAPMPVSAR
ncbi:hypothetical protein [Variovorax sp. DAIF25]|uniref:hypothetical protein n=1 Tax=Variovorax sp. DAIF25 TaxID=3080983 RepID=UPI003D6BE229